MPDTNDFRFIAATEIPFSRRFNILVVDDCFELAELLKELFAFDGHITSIAVDADEAASMAKNGTFDAVYVDIKLSGMDGFALAAKLRKLPSMNGIPFVAMSGISQDHRGHWDSMRHFDYFFLKPTSLDDLLLPLKKLAANFKIGRDSHASE